MVKIIIAYFILASFNYNSKLFAQQKEFIIENITQQNGLPSNESYFVYIDSKNFMWIATDQGVVRFDGVKMEYFNLPDNVVFKIREDDKGRVWFFSHTAKLAFFYNGRIYPYKYNNIIAQKIDKVIIVDALVKSDDELVIAGTYKNYLIDANGKITVSSNGYGTPKNVNNFQITKVNSKSLFTKRLGFNGSDSLILNLEINKKNIRYLMLCKMNMSTHYGCVTNNEKEFFFFSGNKLIKFLEDGSYQIKIFQSRILCLSIANKNLLWVGLEQGGAILINSDLSFSSQSKILENKSISSIAQDLEGGTWFSTLEKGLFYIKSLGVDVLERTHAGNEPVSRIIKLDSNTFFFANSNGLFRYSIDGLRQILKLNTIHISDLLIDNNQIFIAGAYRKSEFYKRYKLSGLTYGLNCVTTFLESTNEIIKYNSSKFLISFGVSVRQVNFLSNNFKKLDLAELKFKPNVLFADSKKQIWVGSNNNLYLLDTTNYKCKEIGISSSPFQKGVTCMRQMDNGFYTIGIRFGGITLMNENKVVANITEENGLLSNSIKYLLPLKDELWAATAKGISVISFQSYNPVRYKITNIGKNIGLYNILINQLISYQGNILAATSNGIYTIHHPQKIVENTPAKIPFYIKTVSYYNGDTTNLSSLTVPYQKSKVKINYAAICFNSPNEVKYFYRIKNKDSIWQAVEGTELVFENLAPGTYNLELKAEIINQRRTSDVLSITIFVEKPWWQTLLFILLIFVLSICSIFLFIKKKINKIRNTERQKRIQRTTILELEQTALRSQMNPHFIFNCLTSIQQSIISGQSSEANEQLVKFSRLIRKTMELSSKPFIKISEEINYLNEYSSLEQYRFSNPFQLTFDVDNNIDPEKIEIPNMILQPIVENCLRHGIKHSDIKHGHIIVEMQKFADYIQCIITDNGIGRGRTKSKTNFYSGHKGYGMDIVQKRLSLLHSDNFANEAIQIKDLKYTDGSVAGMQVILQLPFKSNE